MRSLKPLMMLSVFLALGTALGCDPSKAELETTKATLASVTAERDGLKTALDASKAQATALQAQLADVTAKLAAATVAAAPVAAAPEPAKKEEKKGGKHAKAEAAAATPTPAGAPAPTTGPAKEARRGAGHF